MATTTTKTMAKTIFNKIRDLPFGLRDTIYSYDPTYIHYFRDNVITPLNVQNYHTELMSELTNVMQFYWVELDRYSTIRNFTGNLINVRSNIPTLLPVVMAGNRTGPP